MNDQRVVGGVRAGTPVLSPGHVWLAGAGPGDPGLLTRDAFAGLSQADVVVHDALVDHRVLALAGPPIVLYMAMRNLATIAQALMRGGLAPSTPAAIIVSATTTAERVLVSTLDRVASEAENHQLGTPSIIVIGNIVNLRDQLLDTMAEAAP